MNEAYEYRARPAHSRQCDVFNGDADGIFALHQLRLAMPLDSTLVTGTKRDIALLARVSAQANDHVTVLDISLDSNRDALDQLLSRGVFVDYFDHHFAGRVPTSPWLAAHLDAAPDVCTSLLVDRHLGGAYRRWAIAAAFGDGLGRRASELAREAALGDDAQRQLRALGEAVNYNAYGDSVADLIVAPEAMVAALRPYADPFEFIAATPWLCELDAARNDDLARAMQQRPWYEWAGGSVYLLPDAAWARRVRGVFGNALAESHPQRTHAVLTPCGGGCYVASVRAPLAAPRGADALCRGFGGNGRAGAAGIDALPAAQTDAFIAALARAFAAP